MDPVSYLLSLVPAHARPWAGFALSLVVVASMVVGSTRFRSSWWARVLWWISATVHVDQPGTLKVPFTPWTINVSSSAPRVVPAVVLGFAVLAASHLTACSGAQSLSSGAPTSSIDWHAIGDAAASQLPNAKAIVDAQITDPAARLAADTAIDAGSHALSAISARSVCEALPQIDQTLATVVTGLVAAAHVGQPSAQTQQALGIAAAVVSAGRVGVAIAISTQCTRASL